MRQKRNRGKIAKIYIVDAYLLPIAVCSVATCSVTIIADCAKDSIKFISRNETGNCSDIGKSALYVS